MNSNNGGEPHHLAPMSQTSQASQGPAPLNHEHAFIRPGIMTHGHVCVTSIHFPFLDVGVDSSEDARFDDMKENLN